MGRLEYNNVIGIQHKITQTLKPITQVYKFIRNGLNMLKWSYKYNNINKKQ
jgi:hypothetical protein